MRVSARILGTAVAIALLSSGCTTLADLLRQPPLVRVDAENFPVRSLDRLNAATRVQQSKRFDAAYAKFLPSRFPARAGDEVFFKVQSRGEPHTLALGTLVDEASAAIDALGPDATPEEIEALPEMRSLPSLLPLAGGPDAEVNGPAAEPCYLDDELPAVSTTEPCPDRSKPRFNGRQTFYNSGWLEERSIFKLPIAGDIEPGEYSVICLVHRAAMLGVMEVFESSKGMPNNADLEDDYVEALRIERGRLAGAALEAWAAEDPARAQAGYGVPATASVVVAFPYDPLEVEVGEPVTWSVNGTHSISFKPPDGADDGLLERDDGRVRLNREAWDSAGSPPLPAAVQGAPRRGPPKAPDGSPQQGSPGQLEMVEIDGGTWDGEATHHSGVLRSLTPASVTYTLRFSRPGTYRYICVIHPTMTGEITVERERDG